MLAARRRGRRARPGGERTIPIDDFFQGPFTTTLEPDRDRHRGPRARPGAARRAAPTSSSSARSATTRPSASAVQLTFDNGNVGRAGIALTGVGPTNLRRVGGRAGARRRGARRRGDPRGGRARGRGGRARTTTCAGRAEYKRHVVRVFTERALRAAAEAARALTTPAQQLPELRRRSAARGARPARADPAVGAGVSSARSCGEIGDASRRRAPVIPRTRHVPRARSPALATRSGPRKGLRTTLQRRGRRSRA